MSEGLAWLVERNTPRHQLIDRYDDNSFQWVESIDGPRWSEDEEEADGAEIVSPEMHRLALAAARSEGFAKGYAEGKELGKAAARQRYADIIQMCQGPRANRIERAIELAGQFPTIPAAGIVDMAGAVPFPSGPTSLAERGSGMDSLSLSLARIAREGV